MVTQQGPVIGLDDRVFLVAITGGGKSHLMHYFFDSSARQRVCVDVNDAEHFHDDGTGVQRVVGDPSKIDWKKYRTIHYVPAVPHAPTDKGEYQRLFLLIQQHLQRMGPGGPGLDLWIDETYGPTTKQQAPSALQWLLKQGRKFNCRMYYAAQRPVDVWPDLRAMAGHVIVFAQPLEVPDEKRVGQQLGYKTGELNAELARLARKYKTSDDPRADLGVYAHLHWQRKGRLLFARSPLPAVS